MKSSCSTFVVIALVMLGIMLAAFSLMAASAQVSVTTVPSLTATPVAVSVAPSPTQAVTVSVTAVPTAGTGTQRADIINYGTDKDTYNRGDTANGYITLKNTGNSVINDVTIGVTVARSVPVLGSTTIGSKDFKVSGLNIQPGETKKAEYAVNIPSEYQGFSTAGDYQVNGKVSVGGNDIGSFSKSIKVV